MVANKDIIFSPADQRLDLNKLGPNDNDTVRGQIVGKKHTHTLTVKLHTPYVGIENKSNHRYTVCVYMLLLACASAVSKTTVAVLHFRSHYIY